MQNKESIFISYARKDSEIFANRLFKDLNKRYKVWWDKISMEIRGKTFLQEIRDAIASSDRVIAIISPGAVESHYVLSEWEHAILFSKQIIPVLYKGEYSQIPNEFEIEIGKDHYIDFRDESRYKEAVTELHKFLSEPPCPLGDLINVPILPPHFINRNEEITKIGRFVLEDIFEPSVINNSNKLTVIYGICGVGKSVIATAFAISTKTRRAFEDGIIWVNIGQNNQKKVDIIENMRIIGTSLGDKLENYGDLKNARISLSKVLSDKKCLIILDDVWELEQVTPFINSLGIFSRVLITTRIKNIYIDLNSHGYKIKCLSKNKALDLLADICETEVKNLPEEVNNIVHECGCLPFALYICGLWAHKGIPWSHIKTAFREFDLERYPAHSLNYSYSDLFKPIEASIKFLKTKNEKAVERYHELAVFPNEQHIPQAAIRTLWAYTGKLSEWEVSKLLVEDMDGLLTVQSKGNSIFLHDIYYDYLQAKTTNLTNLHNKFLIAYCQKCENGWKSGPDDGYFFENLVYHLKNAGRNEELKDLLLDFGWIKAKLEKKGIQSLINDYSFLPRDEEIKIIEGALYLSSNVLVKDKTQISGQLSGRLQSFKSKGIKSLLRQVKYSRDVRLMPNTCNLEPPGGQLKKQYELNGKWINTAKITENNRYVISASRDKKISVFDIEEEKILNGPSENVFKVAITREGSYAALVTLDRKLKVWDIKKGKTTIVGEEKNVMALEITENGKHILLETEEGIIKEIDIESKETKLIGKDQKIRKATFAKNGEYLISISEDGTINVRNIKEEVHVTLKTHIDLISTVSVTKNGRYIVIGSKSGIMEVWDTKNRKIKARCSEDHNWIDSVTISENGNYVVSTELGTIRLWDIDKKEVKEITGHESAVIAISVSENEKNIISVSKDGTVKLWDITKSNSHVINPQINSIAISPYGEYAISIYNDGNLKVWDVKKGKEEILLKGFHLAVSSILISKSKKYLISSQINGTIKVWDTCEKKETNLYGHHGDIIAMAITKDNLLISVSTDGDIKIWEFKGRKKIQNERIVKGYYLRINEITITEDEKYNILASSCGKLSITCVNGNLKKIIFNEYCPRVKLVGMVEDRKYVILVSTDGNIKIWDLTEKREIETLGSYLFRFSKLAITKNGKYIISLLPGMTLKVVSTKNKNESVPSLGNEYNIKEIGLTDDGKYVIVAFLDGTLKTYLFTEDKEEFEEQATMEGHEKKINKVAIAEEGTYAISVSNDKTLKVWDIMNSKKICSFTADSVLLTCDISRDGKTIVAGDKLGMVHFLRLEK